MQTREPTFVTAAIEEPTDLTAQMTAAIISSTMALHNYGWITTADLLDNFKLAKRLYNVTLETKGVVKHYRSLWTSDSFYDDRLWAVRCPHARLSDTRVCPCLNGLCAARPLSDAVCVAA